MVSKSVDAPAVAVAEPATSNVPLRRNWNFQALWTSEAFAAIAKETAEFGYPLLILATTGSALYASAVASVQLVTASLMSIPAGHLADRFDRRRLLLFCNLTRVALLILFGVLIFTQHTNLLLIMGVAVLSSICLSISQPTGLAAIKALVPPDQVTTAISQNQIRFFGATMAGPPIGGALFGIARSFPYFGAAISFLIASFILVFIKKPMQTTRSLAERNVSIKTDTIAGLKFIRRQPILFMSIIWVMGSNAVFNHTGVFIAIAATATDRGAGAVLIGVTVAFAGGGGLFGSFIASWVLKHIPPTVIMFWAAWIGPLAAALLAIVPGVVPLGIIVGFVFMRGPIVSALFLAYVAALVPDKEHGRVLGAVFFLTMIVQPIGIIVIGAIFDAAGPFVVFSTVGAVALAVAFTTFSKTIRHLPRPEELKETSL